MCPYRSLLSRRVASCAGAIPAAPYDFFSFIQRRGGGGGKGKRKKKSIGITVFICQ